MNAASENVEPALIPNADVDAAFGKALMDIAPPLHRRAFRLTRDPVKADDLLQDTLTRAWSARRSFQPGTNLKAWTFTILRNLFLTQMRQSRNIVDLDDIIVDRLMATDADQYERAELKAVLEAIDHLPTDQRLALSAIALEGLDYVSAARVLNVTQGTLKSRVRRARVALTRLVEVGLPRPAAEPRQGNVARAGYTSRLSAASFRRAWATSKKSGQSLWIG